MSFLKEVLATLQQQYGLPVDMEFALSLVPGPTQPEITFHLLQCRPQSTTNGEAASAAPLDLVEADRFFLAQRMVPKGRVSKIEYLVYVDPLAYGNLPAPAQKREVARYARTVFAAVTGQSGPPPAAGAGGIG